MTANPNSAKRLRSDSHVPMEAERKHVWPLLAEFARWLKERDYDSETVEELLYNCLLYTSPSPRD